MDWTIINKLTRTNIELRFLLTIIKSWSDFISINGIKYNSLFDIIGKSINNTEKIIVNNTNFRSGCKPLCFFVK